MRVGQLRRWFREFKCWLTSRGKHHPYAVQFYYGGHVECGRCGKWLDND